MTIRLRDHLDAELLAALPPRLAALANTAEWSMEATIARVTARDAHEVPVHVKLRPNEAARELERLGAR